MEKEKVLNPKIWHICKLHKLHKKYGIYVRKFLRYESVAVWHMYLFIVVCLNSIGVE